MSLKEREQIHSAIPSGVMNLKPVREWVDRVTKQANRFPNLAKASENDLKLMFLKELKECRCYASTSFFFQKHSTSASIKAIPYDGICCVDFFGVTFYEKKNQEKPVFFFSYDYLTFVVGNLDKINFGYYELKEKVEHQITLTTSRAREICEDTLGYLEMRMMTNKKHLYAGIYLREQSVERDKVASFKDEVVEERKKKCLDALMDHALLPITHPTFIFQKDSLLIKTEVSRMAYQKRRMTIMKSSLDEAKRKMSESPKNDNSHVKKENGLSEIREEEMSMSNSDMMTDRNTSREKSRRKNKMEESEVIAKEKENNEKQKMEEEMRSALNETGKKEKNGQSKPVEPPSQVVVPNPVVPDPPKPEEIKSKPPMAPENPNPAKTVDTQGRRRTVRGKIMLGNKGKEEEEAKAQKPPEEKAPLPPPKVEEKPPSNNVKLNKAIGGALSKMPASLRKKKGQGGNKPTNEDDEIFKVEERRFSRVVLPPKAVPDEEKKSEAQAPLVKPPPAPKPDTAQNDTSQSSDHSSTSSAVNRRPRPIRRRPNN